jgi:hypothetical protein
VLDHRCHGQASGLTPATTFWFQGTRSKVLRDPQRRDEAISLGVELANDLLAEPAAEEGPEEISEAIEELQAVEESIIETPEEALAALNAPEAGIPAETRDALELDSCLGRELDRRWCLGLLARKGDLRGALLSQALDLVASEYSRKDG